VGGDPWSSLDWSADFTFDAALPESQSYTVLTVFQQDVAWNPVCVVLRSYIPILFATMFGLALRPTQLPTQ
jgi:hypothetical protein